MVILKFYELCIFSLVILLLSCSSTASETGTREIAFPQDSTFEIKGISLEAPARPIGIESMNEVANINANWIALMPYAFCRKDDPIVYFSNNHQWWGERKEGIIGCIGLARQKQLKIMLKPHLWISNGAYTGHLNMNDDASWKKWEDSYLGYILHFASLADSMQVELFCLGTELGTSVRERPHFWSSLIDTVKKVYHGKLTYAANWDDYAQFNCWDKLDYIGIDGYFPLTNSSTPAVNEISLAWKTHIQKLEQFSKRKLKPVLFTEYGYRNADNCAAEPWKEGSQSVNDEGQANAYAGFYNSFSNREWFKGGFVWKWHGSDLHKRQTGVDFTPQGKPALNVIRRFFGGR